MTDNNRVPQFTAITPEALADRIVRRAGELSGRVVVAVDGPDAADPVALALRVVDRVHADSRTAGVVALHDYVRPASLRFEYGRDDETSYRDGWFDYAALEREVLTPFRAEGRWLPALWDERTDRSARARPGIATADTVLVVAGPMLLGRGLAFDLTVALRMSEAAQRRRTEPARLFTVDAVRAHDAAVSDRPDFDVVWDHPDRPALRG